MAAVNMCKKADRDKIGQLFYYIRSNLRHCHITKSQNINLRMAFCFDERNDLEICLSSNRRSFRCLPETILKK